MTTRQNHAGGRTVVVILAAVALTAGTGNAAPAGEPNVVVIVADDLGYADVGFHGCKDFPTPHLDALAKAGVVCTNGYVTCPVCAPSRAGLLTGRYQQRLGFEDNAWNARAGLTPEVSTIADALKSAGYSTCAIGKWHLGQLPQYRPLVRGFTDHYGFLGGGRSFLPLKDSKGVAFVPMDPDQVDLWRNTERVADPEHVTEAFGEEAAAFIGRSKGKLFFLYLAFNAPHVPLQATEKYLKRFPNLKGARKTYAAMVSAMDDAVGRVTDKLRAEGLDDNTLIFFLSDNGGHPPANTGRNHPLRGEKSTLYEGGIRVPFVVKWAGRLPAGITYAQPVISLDIMATALAAAGVKPAKGVRLDGVDLVPHLRGETKTPPHETLYWRFIDRWAVRHGRWKLASPTGGAVVLHDLAADVGESKDVSEANPDVVRKLKELYAGWVAELPPTPVRAKPLRQPESP